MPLATVAPARRFPGLLCLLVVVTTTDRAAAGAEQDQFEEKVLARSVERAVRVAKSDRGAWVKELGDVFGEKVGNPLKEEDYGAWFKLLAGEGAEWRRDSSPSTAIAGLFDRIVQKIELGPVPSVKRDEFMRYARRHLVNGNPQAGEGGGDPNEEPDKVYRALDRNSDGVLEVEEMTTKLREESPKADGDGNGRIDKDEYRAYFRRRVVVNADAAIKATEQLSRVSGDGKTTAQPAGGVNSLPGWFADVDADEDGQVALSEWRVAGRALTVFQEMDLDGDGLLTKEEYARFARMKEKELAPPPPGNKKVVKM